VAATVVVSTLACNAAAIIGVSRACYAMAADGLFIRAAASVHPRYRTPHVAIALTCGWSALLTLTGTYKQLYTWVTFAWSRSACSGDSPSSGYGAASRMRIDRIAPGVIQSCLRSS